MNNALVIFLAGVIIAAVVEEFPKPFKTIVWVTLIVIGVVYGALNGFKA